MLAFRVRVEVRIDTQPKWSRMSSQLISVDSPPEGQLMDEARQGLYTASALRRVSQGHTYINTIVLRTGGGARRYPTRPAISTFLRYLTNGSTTRNRTTHCQIHPVYQNKRDTTNGLGYKGDSVMLLRRPSEISLRPTAVSVTPSPPRQSPSPRRGCDLASHGPCQRAPGLVLQ